MLGGTLIVAVDGTGLDPKGRYNVVVSEEKGKTELARVALDLARMR